MYGMDPDNGNEVAFFIGFLAGVLSRELEKEDLSPRPPLLQGKGEVNEALQNTVSHEL